MHIVQFYHPGSEFLNVFKRRPDGKYDVPWNTGDHHRRLVEHLGQYADAQGLHDGELRFWTEWEGKTCASQLQENPDAIHAKYLHQVKCPVAPAGMNNATAGNGCCGQNTDPCVFGRTFKYSNCRQDARPMLRQLSQGSLIVFWSRRDGKFCLDTVFVVGDTAIQYQKKSTLYPYCSREYRNLTVDRLPDGNPRTFYRGVEYRADQAFNDQIFSFTPARLKEDTDSDRRCCLLINGTPLNRVFNMGATRNIKTTVADANLVFDVWREIVKQVTAQGFVLGVHFDWPKATNVEA